MTSGLTLVSLRSRVRSMLGDPGAADWSNDRLDAGIRAALEEYSRAGLAENAAVLARQIVGTMTPGAGARELDLSSLSPAVLLVDRIWYPYDAAVTGAAPVWVSFDFWRSDGKPIVFLKDTCGDGLAVARVLYRAMHALSGLDGAAATSFSARDDGLILLGAAGHVCLQRPVDLGSEDERDRPGSGYGAAASRWLREFRSGLRPSKSIRVVPFAGTEPDARGYYDAGRLEWVSYGE